jgi:16S rRNA (cytosine967-C5)-methyltransferase
VLRRNPDAKWKLTPEYLEKLHQLQAKIIKEYSVLLKKNGLMVYSTCSVLPSENQHQVENFLNTHSNFKLIREKTLLPSEGFDGFYMALIKKTEA